MRDLPQVASPIGPRKHPRLHQPSPQPPRPLLSHSAPLGFMPASPEALAAPHAGCPAWSAYSTLAITIHQPPMDNKDRMDDLASLFLPDLLHPLPAGLDPAVKQEDDFASYGRSNVSTPSSIGLGFLMLYGKPDGAAQSVPDAGDFAQFAGFHDNSAALAANTFSPQYAHMMGQYSAQYPYGGTAMPNYGKFQGLRHLPYPEDTGHTLHYADFVPAEAGVQQRHQLRQHMLPMQPALNGSSVIGSFDNMPWVTGGDVGQPYAGGALYGSRPGASAEKSSDEFAQPTDAERATEKLKSKAADRKKPAAEVRIKVDYSPDALRLLLDMKRLRNPSWRPLLTTKDNDPVPFHFQAFLHGRFLTNDIDNSNFVLVTSRAVNPDTSYEPLVISCYRRNFINIHFAFSVSNQKQEPLYVAGEQVQRFRIDIDAITNGGDKRLAPLYTISANDKSSKEQSRAGDNIPIQMIDPGHHIDVQACTSENYFMVKKLQFKSATANSINLTHQTYYRLATNLVAELPSGDCVLDELVSTHIIVRGRNPFFYKEKNDLLIKPKSPHLIASYTDSPFSVKPAELDVPAAEIAESSIQAGADEEETEAKVKEQYMVNEKTEDEVEELAEEENGDENEGNGDNDDSDVEFGSETKLAEVLPNATNLKDFVSRMSSDNNYHYFPILNVYYLPPINVVYFPHGAHQANTAQERPQTPFDGESKTSTPSTQGAGRKRGSNVYFR